MGQCDEMTYQGTRQDDGRPEQQVKMLREEGKQYQHHNVEKHDAVIELPRTDLVIVARSQEMDNARNGQDDQESIGKIVGEGNAVVGGEKGDVVEGLEMPDVWGEVTFIEYQHNRDANPIRGEQAQNRCYEGAQAEAADEDHDDPVDGDEHHQMYLYQTGQTKDEERVVDPSHGFAVLVCDKKRRQTRYESQSDNASFQ